jgi:hypothetical protein
MKTPDAVEYCDRICAVIRRNDLNLKECRSRLRSIIKELVEVLERS